MSERDNGKERELQLVMKEYLNKERRRLFCCGHPLWKQCIKDYSEKDWSIMNQRNALLEKVVYKYQDLCKLLNNGFKRWDKIYWLSPVQIQLGRNSIKYVMLNIMCTVKPLCITWNLMQLGPTKKLFKLMFYPFSWWELYTQTD